MRILLHPKLALAARLFVGGVFVYAAFPKIADPPAFAHMIYNYKLVPGPVINLLALLLPWLELVSGVALITGIWKRTAAGMILLLLFVFMGALGINLIRDHAVDCGCFNLHAPLRTHEELISDMKTALWRDVGLLLVCLQILISDFKSRVSG